MSSLAEYFLKGGSYLISRANYEMYINGRASLGRWNEALQRGELFIAPSEEMDRMLETFPNQPRVWEEALRIGNGSLGQDPVRVDIYNPMDYGLRPPDGYEIGYTGEGTPGIPGSIPAFHEGVTDLVPNPEENPEIGRVSSALDPAEVESWVDLKLSNGQQLMLDSGEERLMIGPGEDDLEEETLTVSVEEETETTQETEVRESMGADGTVETETVTTTVTKDTTVTIEENTNSNENNLDDGMEL